MDFDKLDNVFLMSEGEQLMAEAQLMRSILGGDDFELISESSMVSSLMSRAKEIIKKIIAYIVRVIKRIINFFSGNKSSEGGGGGGAASAVYQAAKVLLPSQITNLTDLVMNDSTSNPKVKNDVKDIVSNMTVNNINNTTNLGISKEVFDAIIALYKQGEDTANKSMTKIVTNNALNELNSTDGERVIKDGLKAFVDGVKAKEGARLRKIMYDDMILASKQTIFIPRIMGTTPNECNNINKFIKDTLIKCIVDTIEMTNDGAKMEAESKRLNIIPGESGDAYTLFSFVGRKEYAPVGTRYLSESFLKGHPSVQGVHATNTPKEIENVLNGFYKKGSVINGGIEMLFTAPDAEYKLGLKFPKEAYGMVMSIIPTVIKDFNINSTTNKQFSFDSVIDSKGVEPETIKMLEDLSKVVSMYMDDILSGGGEEEDNTKKGVINSAVTSVMTTMNAIMYLSTIFTDIGPKFLDYIKMVATYNDTVEANLDLIIGEAFMKRVREIKDRNNAQAQQQQPQTQNK